MHLKFPLGTHEVLPCSLAQVIFSCVSVTNNFVYIYACSQENVTFREVVREFSVLPLNKTIFNLARSRESIVKG